MSRDEEDRVQIGYDGDQMRRNEAASGDEHDADAVSDADDDVAVDDDDDDGDDDNDADDYDDDDDDDDDDDEDGGVDDDHDDYGDGCMMLVRWHAGDHVAADAEGVGGDRNGKFRRQAFLRLTTFRVESFRATIACCTLQSEQTARARQPISCSTTHLSACLIPG